LYRSSCDAFFGLFLEILDLCCPLRTYINSIHL
jgi:hypothetical protein